ncbi:MAG TPA: retroviral-like aspartic protease family protein [Bryobacteraceae bacterium]|nr:retroviral-like aspartic protease family protein [Bryobacteraceae bacterium]
MVDTGAESTRINAAVLEAIGIERRKKDLQFQMANGQIITRSVGYAVLTVDQPETVDEVVFAEADDLQVDARCEKAAGSRPVRQCSRRASAIRAIGAGPPPGPPKTVGKTRTKGPKKPRGTRLKPR